MVFVLIIRDGWGYGKKSPDNALLATHLPTEEMLEKTCPKCLLQASGEAVGLPKGQIGTSEIGHITMGAGRVVYYDLLRVNNAIKDGTLAKNKVLNNAFSHAKHGRLHLMGLFSPGGVHSHINHLYALLLLAKKAGIKESYVHAFLDGRDVPPQSAQRYFTAFDAFCKKNKINAKIATVMGRYYAMDRDTRWDRTALAYNAMVLGIGRHEPNVKKAILESYAAGIDDEFIKPIVTGEATIRHNDTLIFFNFRLDRARQITRAFHDPLFHKFKRKYINPYFVAMTKYEDTLNCPVIIPPIKLRNTLGEIIAKHGWKQLRIAETEKYAHVTFFFNGLSDILFKNEQRMLIHSPKIATYDLKPEMSAIEISNAIIKDIRKDAHEFYVINFANADMVGHTGKFKETQIAAKTVDVCVGRILSEIKRKQGLAVITADHGNCEDMYDEKEHQPMTAHSLNRVRLFIYSTNPQIQHIELKDGGLANVAPTILKLLKIPQPKEMTAKPLF
ncbi:MAG: 2,3-bisphosphoglycerate-independent phosphoglycerate mutase [Nanoarchaeota archaeon]